MTKLSQNQTNPSLFLERKKKLIFTRKDEPKYRHIGQAIEFEVKARNVKKKSNLNEVYEEMHDLRKCEMCLQEN